MNFIKTPVKGMPEQMPSDMVLREYVLKTIKQTYFNDGFSQIETPIVEHIENLTSNQGGENEKLIFKILKRGEKLENTTSVDELCDCGLRYDLTVPLSRFYANNNSSLPMPFKAFQIGNVFRADRPQKGRYRQFTQCDIDVLGDNTNLAEIELISATTKVLNNLGIKDIKIIVNDRNILKAMAKSCNFPEEKFDSIFIILDKLDKIGVNGVKENLIELGLDEKDVIKYCKYFSINKESNSCKSFFGNSLNNYIDEEVLNNLEQIISISTKILSNDCHVVFSPTLVRGMSYYTGPIFEIQLADYQLSVCGGGRYDEMIGKFCGTKVCACGLSIGFERIIEILKTNNFNANTQVKSTAILIAKDANSDKVYKALLKANQLRDKGERVLISPRNKNVKFQKDNLITLGYTEFIDVFNDSEI